MLRILFKIFKRLLLSAFILYGYNVLIEPIGLIVPINFITLGIITVFGVPAFLSLILIKILIY